MLAIDDPLSSASAISQKTLQIRWMPKLIIPALTAIKCRLETSFGKGLSMTRIRTSSVQ
jgi:hypothetical protein